MYSITITTRSLMGLADDPESVTYTYHSQGDEMTTSYVVAQILHDFRTNPHTELLAITVNKIQEN